MSDVVINDTQWLQSRYQSRNVALVPAPRNKHLKSWQLLWARGSVAHVGMAQFQNGGSNQ